MIHAAARWLARRTGRRGGFLAFLALIDWAYGQALVTATVTLHHPDFLLPLKTWGWIWIGMGFVAASGILARRDRVQYGAAATFKALWALLLVFEWTVQHVPQAWVSVVIWSGFTLITLLVSGWPEPPVKAVP